MDSAELLSADSKRLKLEAFYEKPQSDSQGAVVLCHPHPAGGGSMRVHLLQVISKTLIGAGYSCLRFNFRGVCGSEGSHTGGLEEIYDIEGALRFLRDNGFKEERMFVCGWSFGAYVAYIRKIKLKCVLPAILISPPVSLFDFFGPLDGLDFNLNMALLAGASDQFADRETLKKLSQITSSEIRLIDGADHFLFDWEDIIATEVLDLIKLFSLKTG